MITKEQVYERLRTVMDPELHIDIVSLGLIYHVGVGRRANGLQRIKVTMTLTTPGCPLVGEIDRLVKDAVGSLVGISREQVETELTWDPPWTKAMMSEEAKLELGVI